MLHNKKIIVSDYDGTFFLNEHDIIKNVNKVNSFRSENNLFVIATGNNLEQFMQLILKYNINYDYLILDQGSCIFDNQGNLLKSCFLDYNISKTIIDEIVKAHKEYKLCNPYSDTQSIEEKNITKIAVNFIDLSEALDFTNKMNENFGKYIHAYTMIFPDINIVEIISSQTDKNEAIKYIVNKENILKDNVYTIGDGYNDISMIQNFNGFCMENSVDELLCKCPNRVSSVSDLIDKIMYDTLKI